MAAEKVTVMVLKVDLQCPCCYKKVKKTICKIPQIRDQIYDEKANIVTIKVVSCCPEIVRNKLYSKGGKTIKSIEIKEPTKPKDAEKPKPDGKGDKPKQDGPPPSDKPKAEGKGDKPKQDGPPPSNKPKAEGKSDKPKQDGPPPSDKPKDGPKAQPVKIPEPAPKLPAVAAAKGPEPVPVGVPSVFPYMGPTYDGYANGPYYQGYYSAPPPPAQPCYEGYYGYGYGYGRNGYPGARYDGNSYFSEENSQGCYIM